MSNDIKLDLPICPKCKIWNYVDEKGKCHRCKTTGIGMTEKPLDDRVGQLERELTEVTKQRDELKRWTSVNGVIDLQRERDEAREELTAVTEQRDGLRKRIAQLENQYAKACKNVEDLAEIGLDQMDKERSTNRKLSDYKKQRDALAEALRVATAYPLSDSWYKQAIEALATLKPCD